MRLFAAVVALLIAACSPDADDKGGSPDGDMADSGVEQDAGGRPDVNQLDSGVARDVDQLDSGEPLMDVTAMPDVDDSCVDSDSDGSYVDCDDFAGVPGPDCDDADPNNWDSCATCMDGDGDGQFAGCDAYSTLAGPDCDDTDANAWGTCGTCVDTDSDGWVGVCDAYDGLQGPDCNDADADNWMSCATCVDGDADGYRVGCDVLPTPDCDDSNGAVNPGAQEVMNNGLDDDCDPASVDVCDYTPVPAQDPESGFAAGITAEHNYWRWRVGTAPLQWNATLAASATAYAQNCIWAHDPNRSPDAGFNYVGENLYLSGGQPSNALMLNAVTSWAAERDDYDYGDVIVNGGPMVGHYTQVTWDDSTDVGCGYAYCPSVQGAFAGTIVACRYGPGGNYLGQTPYDFVTDACVDLDNDDVFQSADADDTDRSVQ